MVQFDVDKEGNVLNVETYSQIEGIALNDLANSIKSFRWKFELKSENKYSKVYFPIIVKNRILSIPETQINYCNPNFNFIEEQIHKKVVRQ